MGRYYNYLTRDGKGVSGVGVVICTLDGVKKDYEVTDENGFYQFTNLSAGTYQVRFFGMGFDDTSWFDVQVVGEGFAPIELEPLVLSEIPILEIVEEEAYITEQGEMGKIFVTVSGIDITAGKLATLEIYFKPTISGYVQTEFTLSGWDFLNSVNSYYSLDEDAEPMTTVSGTLDIPLLTKPVYYDFKILFLNPIGLLSKYENEILQIEKFDVELNGIPDISEYIGVSGLEIKNEKLRVGNVVTLASDSVVISWEDPRDTPEGNFVNAAGNSVKITRKQLDNWTKFVVFMFVSNGVLPPSGGKNYPVKNETNGKWYFLDQTLITRGTFRLPKRKNVMLWVGFQSRYSFKINKPQTPEGEYVY